MRVFKHYSPIALFIVLSASLESEELALSGQGVDSAPNSVFRILGASPKFKIIEFYG